MLGALSTSTPSAAEAAVAVPRRSASESRSMAAVADGGTAMVAVMITLPAATWIETSDGETPATAATRRCRLEVVLR